MASRIIVVNKGRIVSEGTPAEIKSRGASRTIRCTTSLSVTELWALPSVVNVVREGGVTSVTAGNAEAVVHAMLADDETLSDLEIVSPGLEEAFLALTGASR